MFLNAAIKFKLVMALFSPPIHFSTASPSPYSKTTTLTYYKPFITLRPNNNPLLTLLSPLKVSADNYEVGTSGTTATPLEPQGTNGSVAGVAQEVKVQVITAFQDPRWLGGTWDLKQFQKIGNTTDWDAVIDAEAKRRKWLEDNPESSCSDNPVVFDTSIIPWWAWIKKFHLPEAELLNGRAAMIGIFMAYVVDSLTGVGLVDQMSNFVCKTLVFIAVAGVLVIRKNEDIETLKKLLEETTFYDKQWQATWQDENSTT